jgi:dTDP-4-dehydrorhamnose 3,5-epimerase
VIFQETRLQGVYVLDLEKREDSRGFFARAFCQREFAQHGLVAAVAQINVARNLRAGTIRGMHFQFPPDAEAKLVRVTRGAVLDVAVDLRPESPTYLQHVAAELTADGFRALYVPERFAHGYQALTDGAELWYQTSAFYAPPSEGGLCPLDPALGIQWPLPVGEISKKDAEAPPLARVEAEVKRRMAV